ncbi:MAG: 16S rRNA (cytidine(1402)-2'-O)-methyltransferase [Bifidobacteriaceae bacterium]|jgi:16S rRNA (cytidine1402-2'-O)-methyltransferase|nr:16S rRNA (cytidine(1402)-2'-O)-methyltransferase [Bifidobacteriaceae bacterium]
MSLVAPGIVLAATPIGDPADASDHLRALLATADLVAAEDTRRLRDLARRLGVKVAGRVVSFYDHNERARLPLLLEQARAGLVVVVSDAGMPLISDPGFPLVRAAIDADIPVTCAPGPSAVLTALALSGLPTDRFAFDGFVPRTAAGRAEWLDRLGGEQRTVVAFESARRVGATLADAADRLGSDRPAVVARELTKPHQELIRGTLGELATVVASRELKGEVTLVIGAPVVKATPDAAALVELVRQVERRVGAGAGLKEAVAVVAETASLSKRALYEAVLEGRRAEH